jgi:hypothetical protein
VSFLPPLGFTTNWGVGFKVFRLGKIDNRSVAENGGKINYFLSSHYIIEARIKTPTVGVDNNADLEHPEAMHS